MPNSDIVSDNSYCYSAEYRNDAAYIEIGTAPLATGAPRRAVLHASYKKCWTLRICEQESDKVQLTTLETFTVFCTS